MEKSLKRSHNHLFSKLKRELRCESVIREMEKVPRERFVPPESHHRAYLDIPLSIGEGQSVSQPYIVAQMLSALGLRGREKVLEVGAGSGYQAAILSLLVPKGQVVTVELVPALAKRAAQLLCELGYSNVKVELAGDTLGCPRKGPFDAIIVAAASPKLPDSLLSQLVVGGRLVIPVGTLDQQDLVQVLRTDEGLSVTMMGSCRFVPLLGQEAFPKPG